MSEDPITPKRLRVTRLDAQGEPIEGSTTEIGGSFEGTGVEPGEWFVPESLDTSRLTTFNMDVEFCTPDPALTILLGSGSESVPPVKHNIEVRYRLPVRRRAWRVVWEWLTRKPRQYTEQFIGVPYAEVSRNPDGSITFSPIHPPESE